MGQAQQETRATAARLAAANGSALGATATPLTAEDVLWGMGQAMSRKFLVEGQVRGMGSGGTGN